jgi:hypothetical protein
VCLFGSAWLVGLGTITTLQLTVWHSGTVFLLPVFALLALYFAIAGGHQWATGRGELKVRETGLPFGQLLAFQVGAFATLATIAWYVGQR